jgi:hypothetical protein
VRGTSGSDASYEAGSVGVSSAAAAAAGDTGWGFITGGTGAGVADAGVGGGGADGVDLIGGPASPTARPAEGASSPPRMFRRSTRLLTALLAIAGNAIGDDAILINRQKAAAEATVVKVISGGHASTETAHFIVIGSTTETRPKATGVRLEKQ